MTIFAVGFYVDRALGQSCSGGGPGSCPNTQSCVCGSSGYCGGSACQWDCSCQNNNGCTGTGVTINCPSGTVRSDTLIGSQCAKMCAGIGTAQVAGGCCDWVTTPASGCDWEPCGTYSNPSKVCRVCDEGEDTWCRTGTTYTYSCTPVCTAPSTPTISTPDDGSSLSSDTVSLQWNAVTWDTDGGCTNEYKVYVGETNPPTTLQATVDSNTTSANFSGTRGTTYYWYVQATNGLSNVNSEIRSFTILDNQITGTIYLDTNNTCSTSVPWTTGGVSVSIDGGAGNAVNGSGVYTGTATVGVSHSVAVSIPNGYVCSTGAGCNTCVISAVSPASNQNFFLSNVREAWWQAEGAGVYVGGLGGGVTVRSEMPSASYRLILAGGAGSVGALLRGDGSTDLGSGSVSDDLWTATSKYKGKKMDYAYFAAQMGVLPTQANDWGADTMNKPGTTKDFHYIDPQSGTATVSSPWVVASGEKYVVFVNGDLRVSANTTVDDGGFLSFVVSGDIVVDPAVTSMQGMYIATGNFETESVDATGSIADVQLSVEGNVISWGTFSLGRSLVGGNINTPAEKFTYRPDLLTNMPDKMKTFAMNWQEVAPGTFGE